MAASSRATAKPAAKTEESETPASDSTPVEPDAGIGDGTTLGHFQAAFKVMGGQLKAQMDDKLSGVKKTMEGLAVTVDDLAATVTELSKQKEPDAAALTHEEDFLSDKVDEAIGAQFDAVVARLEEGAIKHANQLASDLSREIENLRSARAAANAVLPPPNAMPPLDGDWMPGKHILTAIHQVMRAVTYVPKAGDYDGGRSGNYKFRKFDDTAAAIGKAFREYGVFVQTKTINRTVESYEKPFANGGSARWTDVYVEMRYTLTSLMDGSELVVESYGQGKDNSDKATAKAMTMALKTALTQAFMIPTDEPDPDSERPGEQEAPPIGHGQGQQQRPQRQPEQPPAQHQQQDAPPPQRTAESPEQRAINGLAAARAAQNREQLNGIVNYAAEQGLSKVMVTSQGSTQSLQQWLMAIRAELPAAQDG